MKIFFWLRSAVMTLLIPLWVILFGLSSILFHALLNSRKVDNFHIETWARLNLWSFGIRVKVVGLENIPDEGCLFLFSHSSFFDIFAIAGYLTDLRFGAKAELFKIPIFSQSMRAMGTIPIARQNRNEVYKVYEEAKSRFKNKEKFALSPEGGRFYGPHLSSFKAGPFMFAMSAEVPVVPLVILGAYQCLPKGEVVANKDRFGREIELHILKPFSTVGYRQENRSELQAKVYAAMDPVWSEYYARSEA